MKIPKLIFLFCFVVTSLFGQQSERLRLKLSGKIKTAAIFTYQKSQVNSETYQPLDSNDHDGVKTEYYSKTGTLDSCIGTDSYPKGQNVISYRAIYKYDYENRILEKSTSFPQSYIRNDKSLSFYVNRKNSYTIKNFKRDEIQLGDSTSYLLDKQGRDSIIHFISYDKNGLIKSNYTMSFEYFKEDKNTYYTNKYSNLLTKQTNTRKIQILNFDKNNNPIQICFFEEDGKTIESVNLIKYTYYE